MTPAFSPPAWCGRRHGLSPVSFSAESARFFFSDAPCTSPILAGAATMADDGEYGPEFLCIEAANIPATAIPLAPSRDRHLGTRLCVVV